MKKLKSIIVDDESLARDDLKRLLTSVPDIEVKGEAGNLEDAEKLCVTEEPDLIFLDIQMGNENGFDLLPKLQNKTAIIFVTAYDDFAIKAFEVNALDYLLKPVSEKRLRQALEKITSAAWKDVIQKKSFSVNDSVFLKLDNRYHFVKVHRIKYISSADDYSEIKLSGEERGKLTNKTMNEWEERLPAEIFRRIHRFTIVNIDYIESIEPWHNYSHKVYIKNETKPLLMSRRYFSIIKKIMG